MSNVKATKVILAEGGVIYTEAHEDACSHWGEVAAVEVMVPVGTLCDVCDEPITENSVDEQEAPQIQPDTDADSDEVSTKRREDYPRP